VVAVGVAIVYGIAGWWSVGKGRTAFDNLLRPLQTKMALGLCGLALLLALPIIDFGAISASSQMARFAGGKVDAAKFDWKAMAFDFGPAGRKRLAEIAASGPADQRKLAASALSSKNRYDVQSEVEKSASAASLDRYMRVLPEGTTLSPAQRDAIAATPLCREQTCVVTLIDQRSGVVAGRVFADSNVAVNTITMNAKGQWVHDFVSSAPEIKTSATGEKVAPIDFATAPIEVRTVSRRQLYIDGEAVGDTFE